MKKRNWWWKPSIYSRITVTPLYVLTSDEVYIYIFLQYLRAAWIPQTTLSTWMCCGWGCGWLIGFLVPMTSYGDPGCFFLFFASRLHVLLLMRATFTSFSSTLFIIEAYGRREVHFSNKERFVQFGVKLLSPFRKASENKLWYNSAMTCYGNFAIVF